MRPHPFRLIPLLLTAASLTWMLPACQPLSSPSPARTRTVTASLKASPPVRPLNQYPSTATPTARPLHLEIDPAKLKGLEITLWHPFGGEEGQTLDAQVASFNEENEWGITAHVQGFASLNLLNRQVESTQNENNLPNVIAAPVQQLLSWQEERKMLIGLDDYINDVDQGLTPADLADIPRNFLQQDQVDGRQMAIPVQRSVPVIFYNQTWAQELGFNAAPSSPEEFKEQACAAAQANLKDGTRENDGTGGWIVSTDAETLLAWMMSFGLEDPSSLGANGYVFNNLRLRNGFTFLRDLFDIGCAWTSRLPQPYEYFADRNTLFYSGSLEDILLQTRVMQHAGSTDQWGVLPYPSTGKKPAVLISGPSYAIVVASPEQQLASWILIRWLISAKNQAALAQNSGSWPASVTALENLIDFRDEYPAWSQTLAWIPAAQPTPQASSWMAVRGIFSDAAWQIFQANTTAGAIPAILDELDTTVAEVLKHQAPVPPGT